jgi:dimethylamine monooxygenase subunit A
VAVDPLAHARGYAQEKLHALGAALEPDFLLLSPDADGAFRLRGGALCFPTGWALGEKLGHTLDFIHGVVPGLNRALASPIHQFLSRLKPGAAVCRDNWGLAATEELNLHPARGLAGPALPVALERLWLRVEHQAFVALPRTRGVAFGIRIALHRLDAVAADRAVAAGLRRALDSMPPEIAAYKRLDGIRAAVIGLL